MAASMNLPWWREAQVLAQPWRDPTPIPGDLQDLITTQQLTLSPAATIHWRPLLNCKITTSTPEPQTSPPLSSSNLGASQPGRFSWRNKTVVFLRPPITFHQNTLHHAEQLAMKVLPSEAMLSAYTIASRSSPVQLLLSHRTHRHQEPDVAAAF
jgi:hypothetical protein